MKTIPEIEEAMRLRERLFSIAQAIRVNHFAASEYFIQACHYIACAEEKVKEDTVKNNTQKPPYSEQIGPTRETSYLFLREIIIPYVEARLGNEVKNVVKKYGVDLRSLPFEKYADFVADVQHIPLPPQKS